ncbi:hypothetical protein FPSM_01841 [Flavobacterium psychrophilum]|nr:hypothetical protein FPSM_01841 [Flavobacterium psychrophilum]
MRTEKPQKGFLLHPRLKERTAEAISNPKYCN